MAAQSVRAGRVLGLLAGAALCLFLGWASVPTAQADEPLLYQYSFGPDGTENTNFAAVGSTAVDQTSGAVYAIDITAGILYKFDEQGHPTGQISGLNFFHGIKANVDETQVTVDSVSHIVYVTSSNSVTAFYPNGDPAIFSAGPGAGTNQISGFTELFGVAVDANGNIYASDKASGKVRIYKPSGEFLTEFATGSGGNLAVAPNGSVYLARFASTVLEYTPSTFPVTASTTYTAAAAPLEAKRSLTVAVDPATSNVFVAELATFTQSRVSIYDSAGTFVRTLGGSGEEGQLGNQTGGIAIKASSTRVFIGTIMSTAHLSKIEVFAPPFKGPPSVGVSVSGVTADTAVLHATINPNTAETTYYFEYGTSDCAATPGFCAVLPGGTIAAGHEPVTVSQGIGGLQPATTYYYRAVAKNSFGPTVGVERTFTTQGLALDSALSDSRVWEMVSPADKAGGVIVSTSVGPIQAAEDGTGVVYQTRGSIEGSPDGNRATEASTVLARRTATAWSSKDLTPPHSTATTVASGPEYDHFSPDLAKALLEPRDATPLSPMSTERTPYLRENSEPPVYTPLVTTAPLGTRFGGDELHGQVSEVVIDGASRDLSHVVLASNVPLIAGAASGGGGRSLYEWDAGQLHPVSKLPGGVEIIEGILGSGLGSVNNAVSDDGSRVFWSPGFYGAAGIGLTGLYVRDTDAEETARLDVVKSGVGEGTAHPVFQSATPDGSVVFFTDSQRLTADASPTGRDLYRCEIPAGAATSGCASLTDISAPPVSGKSADVRGILSGSSDDGTTVYFVAKGVLDAGTNAENNAAVPGKPNLYSWQQGVGVRFIATLAEEDASTWGQVRQSAGQGEGPPGYTLLLSAAASPSGRYLAFMSQQSLTGEDSRDPASGKVVERVFGYDSATDRLHCISCDPTGASPAGQVDPPHGVNPQELWGLQSVSAALPESTISAGPQLGRYTVYRPRAVLDNGRVFFHAFGGLVPADSNGNWDVYQYEPEGAGNCDASSNGAAVSRLGEGCLSLISSGRAEGESSFLDSSASGDDAFFLTRGRLSVLDNDTVADVYDARVGGTAAVLSPSSECAGETCRPAGDSPNAAAPAAETFSGPGNLKPRHCPKGKRKVRRHGNVRCVRRRHHRHSAHRHRRSIRTEGVHR